MKEVTKEFESANEAVSWLNSNSGMWAGLDHETVESCFETLEEVGEASIFSPMREKFIARLNVRRA